MNGSQIVRKCKARTAPENENEMKNGFDWHLGFIRDLNFCWLLIRESLHVIQAFQFFPLLLHCVHIERGQRTTELCISNVHAAWNSTNKLAYFFSQKLFIKIFFYRLRSFVVKTNKRGQDADIFALYAHQSLSI